MTQLVRLLQVYISMYFPKSESPSHLVKDKMILQKIKLYDLRLTYNHLTPHMFLCLAIPSTPL